MGGRKLVFRGGVEVELILKTSALTVSHLNHSRSLLPSAMIQRAVKSDYELEVGRIGGLLNLKLDKSKGDRKIEASKFRTQCFGRRSDIFKTTITAALSWVQ